MNGKLLRFGIRAALLAGLLLVAGCSTVYEHTRPYLGSPVYAATDPSHVRILQTEPTQPKDRLGEIVLTVEGEPSRDKIEAKLKAAAAKLGADAVFIAYDKMHVYPMVYYDWWWGPMGTGTAMNRQIVGVAIKYK